MVYKILLIENSINEVSFVSDYLRQAVGESCEIVNCQSYVDAFAPLFCGQWDLVLINFNLEGEDSLETLRRVKALLNQPNTPTILYHTSVPNIDSIKKALKEGATACLSKEEMIHPGNLSKILAKRKESLSNKDPFVH